MKKFSLCLFIIPVFFIIVPGSVFLFCSLHVLEAPYLLLTDSQQLGKKLGTVIVRWNGKEKNCTLYSSKRLVFNNKGSSKLIPCLLIYPPFRPFHFSGGNALKITEDSIGIFNDGLTECLPMGKWIYESGMTYPVYSVDDDMKGWAAKYEITRGKTGIRYRVYPSEYSNCDIEFTVPFSFFRKLKSLPDRISGLPCGIYQ